ncbi:MAG: thermonuclease family protein [Acidimicrobiales bacterium]
MQLILSAIAVLLLITAFSALSGSGSGTNVSTRSSSTLRTIAPSTSSTINPSLPPGEDKTVKAVIDGDSFELTDGTKIRLIGIDAPDIETTDCFSAEATTHLRELLTDRPNVRLVYDTSRTDRLERTLAYAYRLPDGLFVNVAMARDGYATQLTTAPNTTHADQIGAAVADARTAARGLWQNCQTSTTAARPAVTSPVVTEPTTDPTEPPTTEPETSTTSPPDPGATTTTAGGSGGG